MRVAWLGPLPEAAGGVAFVGTQLLGELARAGVRCDVHAAGRPEALPEALREQPGLRFVLADPRWEWGRWYSRPGSRAAVLQSATKQLARARAQQRVTARLLERHAAEPYDLVLQFSQLELLGLRAALPSLPPVVLHPEVHAAGELRWHRRERALARRSEPAAAWLAADAMLAVRARRQAADVPLADAVLAPSERFREELVRDYRLDPRRVHVVPNPIDLDRFRPAAAGAAPAGEPLELLVVSRLSVRKGVELVVALSHRLADLAGRVRLTVVGSRTLWSDYTRLLDDLHPAVGRYEGGLPPGELPERVRRAAALLQPSHYEPFALTVGEALASGVPVAVSDAVGAGEAVGERACRRFPAGDLAAFEAAVRRLAADLQADPGPLREAARREAEALFAPEVVGRRLAGVLTEVAGSRRRGAA